MTIDEISKGLASGFHDARVLRISIDYEAGEVTFLIDVDLTLPREKVDVPVRRGELKLEGLLYCVIEPPRYSLSKEYLFSEDALWLTADSSDFSKLEEFPKLPEPIPDGGFKHWFYDSNHNSFIYVAAMNAAFQWCE
ncbi:MAG TPA: hypothetical protein VEX70_13075 [Pyrinomonadaceae bacterium]|jgi:hypothetical protein|nr:hypothetical protein [Pyrinomonadaceae bacterium]